MAGQAVQGGEAIAVHGDYDVDGVSSTALLVGILRRFGLQPRHCVPRRLEEGYGLTRGAIDRVLGAVARRYELERMVLPPNQASGKSFFLARLLSEVAFASGFQSLTHFNRIFRRIAGESPTQYRKKLPKT